MEQKIVMFKKDSAPSIADQMQMKKNGKIGPFQQATFLVDFGAKIAKPSFSKKVDFVFNRPCMPQTGL